MTKSTFRSISCSLYLHLLLLWLRLRLKNDGGSLSAMAHQKHLRPTGKKVVKDGPTFFASSVKNFREWPSKSRSIRAVEAAKSPTFCHVTAASSSLARRKVSSLSEILHFCFSKLPAGSGSYSGPTGRPFEESERRQMLSDACARRLGWEFGFADFSRSSKVFACPSCESGILDV